jgi:hypothetical protein
MAAVYAGDIPDDGGAVSLLKPRVAGAGDITGLEPGRVGVFELEKVFAIDGAVGVEELVGDVGEHGGAAGEMRPLVTRTTSLARNLLMSTAESNSESSGTRSAERSSESFWTCAVRAMGAFAWEWRRQEPE